MRAGDGKQGINKCWPNLVKTRVTIEELIVDLVAFVMNLEASSDGMSFNTVQMHAQTT